MAGDEFLRALEDDGLYTPPIKRHSIEKIRIHNYYLTLFTTAMKDRWPQRAYVGLYSGSGRARIEDTGEIVETTALSACRQRFPFTKYIFVDNDPSCAKALQARLAALPELLDADVIQADVAEAVPRIVASMPSYGPGNGLLSFCFVDPFSAALDFDVIRELSRYRMDFLILLMLGRDLRTNFRRYYEDPSDTRIGSLIDDPNWRGEWQERDLGRGDVVPFLLEKFNAAMTRIGYHPGRPSEAHPIRVAGKRVFLYSLVFYSKSDLGRQFWEATRRGLTNQLTLDV